MAPAAPEPRDATPAAARLLLVRGRLRALAAQRVPRLSVLCDRMREQAERWDLAPLSDALRGQLDAIAGLHFELLVPVGLRAAPPARNAVEFREEVAEVARCAQQSWARLQQFLHACAQRDPAEAHALFEFSRALRSLEQQVTELASMLEGAVLELHREEAEATAPVSQQGYQALGVKARLLLQEVGNLQAACASARLVRETATTLADERQALCVLLRRQAQGLGPPLLKSLGHLIAPAVKDPPDKLRHAQSAAEELRTSIRGALEQVQALNGYGRQLAVTLEALVHLCRWPRE
jgi:hypothetical protein